MLKTTLKFIVVLGGTWILLALAANWIPLLQTSAFGLLVYIVPVIAAICSVKKKSTNKSKNDPDSEICQAINNYNTKESSYSPRCPSEKASPTIEPVMPKSIDDSTYLKYGGPDAELLNIDLMEGHDFEYWCASLLRKIGFHNVEVTQASGDDGVDIIAEKEDIRYAIQCKRYSSDLGNTPIQEVHTGKAVYHCHIGAVMTNRHFTAGGKKAAEATGTLLWDRDWIANKLKEIRLPASEWSATDLNYSDDLFPKAVEAILDANLASPLVLQRTLEIGYSRACSIIDEMEKHRIIGPFRGSTPRAILITKQQWYARMDH